MIFSVVYSFLQPYVLTSAPSSRNDCDTLIQSVHGAACPVFDFMSGKGQSNTSPVGGVGENVTVGLCPRPDCWSRFSPVLRRLLHSASISSHPNLLSFSNLSGVCDLLIPDRITSSNALMLSHSSHAPRGARRSSVGAKARVCVHCGRSFRRTEHLERHVRTRNIYPPYGLSLWLVWLYRKC